MSTTQTTPTPLAPLHATALAHLGWQHLASLELPGRPARFASPAELPPIAAPTATLVATGGPLYRHQADALRHHLSGANVVLATGTGSGKTRVFHLATAELLAHQPRAITLALYPGKALAREQAAKWSTALAEAGFADPAAAALVTGDQSDKQQRLAALRRASVAVFTPDALHAWLLGNLANPHHQALLRRVRLVVLDEAHTLAGVFGSNVLWLLRRLQAILAYLSAPTPRWLAASGTLAQPAVHLQALTGQPFVAIGDDADTSPRHPRRLHLVAPHGNGQPLHAGLGQWLHRCAYSPDPAPRFVVFTLSRVQTESLSLVANRHNTSSNHPENSPSASPNPTPGSAILNPTSTSDLHPDQHLLSERIAPFRAGLSPVERAQLQDDFTHSRLRGLVCTSAFELGIDLPGLDLGFLVGLPETPTSFWQRLGRFGRHSPADIFLLHDGSERTEATFADPASLLSWHALDAALYPDNPILIARHVLCHDHERRSLDLPTDTLATPATLLSASPDFASTHAALLRGELTPALREALALQGHTQPPHLALPLRTIEETYTFRPALGSQACPDGYLTFAQVIREAYPGAVYYHNGKPWRVTAIHHRSRTLSVSPERHYRTKPIAIPPTFVPDLSQPALADLRWPHDTLRLLECFGRATEAINGFTETRGNQPGPGGDYRSGAYRTHGPLYRSYDTTGILLTTSTFADDLVRRELLASTLRQALLHKCPREATEIACDAGTLRVARRDLPAGTRFVALYDTVPGSLRLTAALADPALLHRVLQHALETLHTYLHDTTDPRDLATLVALRQLVQAASRRDHTLPPLAWPEHAPTFAFAPGTTALHRARNLAVVIDSVTTDLDGHLHYFVHRTDDPAFRGQVAATALCEIPGTTLLVPFDQVLAA